MCVCVCLWVYVFFIICTIQTVWNCWLAINDHSLLTWRMAKLSPVSDEDYFWLKKYIPPSPLSLSVNLHFYLFARISMLLVAATDPPCRYHLQFQLTLLTDRLIFDIAKKERQKFIVIVFFTNLKLILIQKKWLIASKNLWEKHI